MSVRTMDRAVAFLAAVFLSVPVVVFSSPAASALDQPTLPQPVADYFAEGLIPRLIDLYGAGDGLTKGTDFDATATVGAVSRVREWTPDFLAGKSSGDPTRLTNEWVAPVSLRGDVLGLATVWINPTNDVIELALFDPADFARQISLAPQGSWLVHDKARSAWFAVTEDVLIPLVAGTSGVSEVTTTTAYQRRVTAVDAAPDSVSSSSGVAVAALVLGVVVLGVAAFVLLPVKQKGLDRPREAEDDGDDDEDSLVVGPDEISRS